MPARLRLSTCLLTAVLAAPLVAAADPLYTVTVLGGAGSSASGINNGGDVVGYFLSGGIEHAFLYSATALTDLGTLGGSGSRANGINDAGAVVGWARTASGDSHAFLYASGKMADLGTLGGRFSEATAINNGGTIVGSSGTGQVNPDGFAAPYAFRYSGGSMQNLGALPGGLGSSALGINGSGQIVGDSHEGPPTAPEYPNHAVIYGDAGISKISPTYGYSAAVAINDHGQVAGSTETPGGGTHSPYAFIYADGVMTMLGVLPGPEFLTMSYASDINNLGRVVGASTVRIDDSHYGYHGFLYDGSGPLLDLNTLIDPASGWVVQEARGINDLGQIAGRACRGGECFAVRLDLVSAVPEPGTWSMLLGGFGLLGLVRRKAMLPRA